METTELPINSIQTAGQMVNWLKTTLKPVVKSTEQLNAEIRLLLSVGIGVEYDQWYLFPDTQVKDSETEKILSIS